jgi:hypothetical protein
MAADHVEVLHDTIIGKEATIDCLKTPDMGEHGLIIALCIL